MFNMHIINALVVIPSPQGSRQWQLDFVDWIMMEDHSIKSVFTIHLISHSNILQFKFKERTNKRKLVTFKIHKLSYSFQVLFLHKRELLYIVVIMSQHFQQPQEIPSYFWIVVKIHTQSFKLQEG